MLMFDPCQYHLLVKKGSINSLQRPGADLGPEYLEHLHYIFAFDTEETVHRPLDRCSVHSFNKGSGFWGHVACAWRCLWYAVRLIRTESIDIVVTVDPYVGGVLALLAARLTGRPVVAGIQGQYDVIYKETGKLINPALKFRWLENLLAWITFSSVDMVNQMAATNRPFALAHGADPKRIVALCVGCDDRNFVPPSERAAPTKDWRCRPTDKLIAYTGRIDRRKYSDHLLNIYIEICKRRDDVTCLLIGDGPDRAWIEEEIRKSGFGDRPGSAGSRIICSGFMPNDEVWKVLPTLDAYVAVLAGLALIEAGCAECPIVAYDTCWHSQFVKDGVTGYLIPFGDIVTYADRICQVLDDPELGRRLGSAAREFAWNTHRARVVMDAHIHYYEALIQGARPPYQ